MIGSHGSFRLASAAALSLLIPAYARATAAVATPRTAAPASIAPPALQGPIINLPSAAFTDGVIDASDFPPSGVLDIDLANAVTGDWATTDGAGQGVYDPSIWAVVFKYSSVTVPTGKAVTFTNHPSRAPVVWLVDQNLTLSGLVDVSARNAITWFEPGPGGFRGAGFQTMRSLAGGFGPGGGLDFPGAGHYAVSGTGVDGTSYGSPGVFPLIGGSGGSKHSDGGWHRGGAGGGAILLASNGTVTLGGALRANPPFPFEFYASGGAVRVVAPTVVALPGHAIEARHQSGFATLDGRVRIECNSLQGLLSSNPAASLGTPSQLLPDPSSTPSIAVESVTLSSQTAPVPQDPRSRLDPMNADVVLTGTGPATVRVVGHFVNPGQTVYVRVTDAYGAAIVYSGVLTGTLMSTTADVAVQIPVGLCAVQARAVL